ncbi:MAG TPA: RimK family protein [Longimicrobiales bacterium]|nr:RimK family protein [Longimicrobiales bacterium]
MTVLIVAENPKLWPLDIPGTELVPARDYLTHPRFVAMKRAKVFNLCRTYGYQTLGYYVSLLAAARGHKPLPSVTTIQDLRQSALVRIVSEDLEELVQRTLAPIKSRRFQVSIYFGRNLAKRYDRLCQALFGHFPAPLLRAEFVRADQWRLHSLRPIAANEIPESHNDFVLEQAQRFFARPRIAGPERPRYDLAILVNPEEAHPPSDAKALRRFARAGRKLGVGVWQIGKQDYGRLSEYDALFIRETTGVNHHTYRFARRAEAEGLVVIDDPESIVRCSNKVYQAELFEKHGIPCPRTLIVHKENADGVGARLGFPCVLKRPDGSFSAGVLRADDPQQLAQHLETFFRQSELVVAQEFVPSSFDWRIGVLDGKPLYACRYHMVRGHWQIRKEDEKAGHSYGRVETLPLPDAPAGAIEIAVRAANLIGRGLYGVDVKEVDGRFLVVEVNDNPNIEAGYEDAVRKDELYTTILQSFVDRIEARNREPGAT